MFEVTGESVLTLYESHLTGAPTSALLVLSETASSETARAALEKSAASLDFGDAPVAWAIIEAGGTRLGAEDVRTIMEGLDPVAAVALDAFAGELLSAAYRTPVDLDGKTRLLGRTVVVFEDFESLMDKPEDKQKAWALLKKLQ